MVKPRCLTWVGVCLVLVLNLPCVIEASTNGVAPGTAQLVVVSTRYMVDVERYRFGIAPSVADASFYPVPQGHITRADYMRVIDASNPAELARHPNQGLHAPGNFLPVLAKYAQTGEDSWGKAIIAMLKEFHATLQKEVAANKYVSEFQFTAAYVPLYRKYLLSGGNLKPDDAWFRDLWLYYCRNLHVWNSEPTEWRGGCHRSMPEAISKGLAAKWYPDIPEAVRWKRYSELVLADFWKYKDLPQNDTGYMLTSLTPIISIGDQWTGDERLYTDPGMKRLWERLLVEITPDGAINPYGPNGGWNSGGFVALQALERVAAKTRDGRFRFAAEKVFNYQRYQIPADRPGGYGLSPNLAALAWLFADDTVTPIEPFSGSLWNKRLEAARLPHTDKQLTERLLGNVDPDPNRGHVCCCWFMTGKEWPDKLVLRSGWDPGDFFGLVELHPTSFPANPGGIMGLNRWGTPFTQIVTSKGASVENRALIEDLTNKANRRYNPDKRRIDEFWTPGKMPDIRSEVTYFKETPQATCARARVQNMDGLPVVYEREFIFAKNRFLATRESVTFEESFKARVAPLWNTHNVGPQLGAHWANTFIHQPVAENGTRSAKTPPVDLLVWFAPRTDCRLEVVDRLFDDPRAVACPNQVRYVWEGTPAAGEKLVFTQIYYPHAPYKPNPTSNNPNPGVRAAYKDDLQATAHASGIRVVRDDPEATVLRLELESGHVEWVVFNPRARSLKVDSIETHDLLGYWHSSKL
jgi:hypothetical protein